MISLISPKTDPWCYTIFTHLHVYLIKDQRIIHGALIIYFFRGGGARAVATFPPFINRLPKTIWSIIDRRFEESKVIIFHVEKPTTPSRCRFFPSLGRDEFPWRVVTGGPPEGLVGKLSKKTCRKQKGWNKISVPSWYVCLVYFIILIWSKYAK